MAIGPPGVHGALVLSLVVTVDKNACVNVTPQFRSMVVNSARDPLVNSTIARRMIAQVSEPLV